MLHIAVTSCICLTKNTDQAVRSTLVSHNLSTNCSNSTSIIQPRQNKSNSYNLICISLAFSLVLVTGKINIALLTIILLKKYQTTK